MGTADEIAQGNVPIQRADVGGPSNQVAILLAKNKLEVHVYMHRRSVGSTSLPNDGSDPARMRAR